MAALWLPQVLRDAGLDVVTLPGWQTRGLNPARTHGGDLPIIHGIVWHHTATGRSWTDEEVERMLAQGRTDLVGPLAQLGLRRSGTWVVVSACRANHNGYGTWGNDAIGVEAYNDGKGEPWPVPQLDSYHLGTAAILAHLGKGSDAMKGHRETDPKRKPDPVGIDLNAARLRIAHMLDHELPNPEEAAVALSESERKMLEELHSAFIGAGHPPAPGAFRRVLQKTEALADAFGIGGDKPAPGAFRQALARAAAGVRRK